MNDYMKNFQFKSYPIIDIVEWKRRQEIMAQEDQAVFDAISGINEIYDWSFYE